MSLDIVLCATAQNEAFARRLFFDLRQEQLSDTRTHIEIQSHAGALPELAIVDNALKEIFPPPRNRLVVVLVATGMKLRNEDLFPVHKFFARNRGACLVIVKLNPDFGHQTSVFSVRHDPGYGVLIHLNALQGRTSKVLRLLTQVHTGDDLKSLGRNYRVDAFFPFDYDLLELLNGVWRDETLDIPEVDAQLPTELRSRPPPAFALERQKIAPSRGPRIIGPRILPVFIILAMSGAIAFAILY